MPRGNTRIPYPLLSHRPDLGQTPPSSGGGASRAGRGGGGGAAFGLGTTGTSSPAGTPTFSGGAGGAGGSGGNNGATGIVSNIATV